MGLSWCDYMHKNNEKSLGTNWFKKCGKQETFGLLCVIACLVKTGLQDFSSCKTNFLATIPRPTPSAQSRPFDVISCKKQFTHCIQIFSFWYLHTETHTAYSRFMKYFVMSDHENKNNLKTQFGINRTVLCTVCRQKEMISLFVWKQLVGFKTAW